MTAGTGSSNNLKQFVRRAGGILPQPAQGSRGGLKAAAIAGRDNRLDDIDCRRRIVPLDIRKDVVEVREGFVGPADGAHRSARFEGLGCAPDDLGRAPAQELRHVVVIVKPTRLDVGLGAPDGRLLRWRQGRRLPEFVVALRHDATIAQSRAAWGRKTSRPGSSDAQSFQDRRPSLGAALAASRGGVDGGGLDLVVDVGLVLLEIALEAQRHLARGLIVGPLVAPGRPRIEHLARHLGAALRDHQP